ncbi:hypothetical protein, partial [Thiohalocapsa marina]|uniref:hypothetical protein n=1 Tax=Thiohalocapsa marina TaxID=424902 RepID=UPI001B87E5CD
LLLFNSDFALASRGGPYMDKRSAVHQRQRQRGVLWTALRLSTLRLPAGAMIKPHKFRQAARSSDSTLNPCHGNRFESTVSELLQ